MLQDFKKEWRELQNGTPGERFQEHYHRRQKTRKSGWRRPLILVSGIAVVAAGVFFLPAPGPGFLIIFAGGGLLAQESLAAARLLDWAEVRLRKTAAWGFGVWKSSPAPVKILLVLVGLGLAAAAAYLGYRLVFAR